MRCAIYTRKSSTEALEQPFNSLDAQRLACSHYIASQASEGWSEIERRYDDGGHSGATLARPALKALLDDIEGGTIEMVVVYKIDRLSRSVRDFVHLLDRFEGRGVTFTSVTQQFSTTGSLGRLTLNILLSFAQFERDLTSDRLKDKFAAVRAKGMRPQGGRPYGYRLVDRRLEIDKAEADVVRRVFSTFIRLGSATSIPAMLNREGLTNQQGRPILLSFVRRMLRNRLYRGDLVHKGRSTAGVHPPIVSQRTWDDAQVLIGRYMAQAQKRKPRDTGMLTGLLFGPTGALLHDGSFSRGKVYRYYGPPRHVRNERPRCENGRFRAPDLEHAVLAAIDPDGRLVRDPDSSAATRELVRSLVERVDIKADLVVKLKTGHTIRVERGPWLKTSRLQRCFISLPARGPERP